MSSTAALPVTRLPQGVNPETMGLYQFFPYLDTYFFDGQNYHKVPATTPPINTPSQQRNDLKAPDRNVHEPTTITCSVANNSVPARRLSVDAPDFTPRSKSPSKEVKTPCPQEGQVDEDKVLEIDLYCEEPKVLKTESTYKVPAACGQDSKNGKDAEKVAQPLTDPAKAVKKAESVSNSGWGSPVNGTSIADSKQASASVPASKASWDQPAKQSSTTLAEESVNTASSVPVNTWSLPSASVAPSISESGWSSKPASGWAAPSGGSSKAENIQKPEPASVGGWGDSREAQLAKNDSSLSPMKVVDTPTKVVDTKKASVPPSTASSPNVAAGIQAWQMMSKMNEKRDAEIRAKWSSAATESNVKSVTNKVATLEISEPVEKPLEPKVEGNVEAKIELKVEPKMELVAPKKELKAELKSCDVVQSMPGWDAPTAVSEASAPKVHDIMWDAGTNGSSGFSQDKAVNETDATKDQPRERAGDEPNGVTATWDQPASKVDTKLNMKEPVDIPSSDNKPPATKSEQKKPSITTSMWAPRDSSTNIAPQSAPVSRSKDWSPVIVPRGDLLVRLKVKLPDGKLGFIEFHEGDRPQEIAERWCRVWKIPDVAGQAKIITEGIQAQLKQKTQPENIAQN